MAFTFQRFWQSNRRVLIWLVLLGLLWLGREFFGLVLISYVLAFIAYPLARAAAVRLRLPYRLALVGVYLVYLGALAGFIAVVTPDVIRQATRLVQRLDQIEQTLVDLQGGFLRDYPGLQRPLSGFLRSVLEVEVLAEVGTVLGAEAHALGIRAPLLAGLAERAEEGDEPVEAVGRFHQLEHELLLRAALARQADRLREHLPVVVNLLYHGSVTLLLALLFSFLILVDYRRLLSLMEELQRSRLQAFYDEAAGPVLRFARIVGQAVRAQATVAVVNTALTGIGLLLLAVPSVTLLCLVVFVCSFVPVLGVFVSTVPIVLVALNAGGLMLAVWSVVLILVVHALEAYLLNPLIYGRHFKLNPVLVLIVLFVGYHAFGVWGMILSVPVTLYVLKDVLAVPGQAGATPDAPPAASA